MRVLKVLQYANLCALVTVLVTVSVFGVLLVIEQPQGIKKIRYPQYGVWSVRSLQVTEQPQVKEIRYQEYMENQYVALGVTLASVPMFRDDTVWIKPPSDWLRLSNTLVEGSFVVALILAAGSLLAKHKGLLGESHQTGEIGCES